MSATRRVIALEMSEACKQKALEVSASVVIPKETDAIAQVKALTGSYGAGVPFECVDLAAMAKRAIDVIRFIADGRIDVQPPITGRIALGDIVSRGFEERVNHKDRNVKIMVRPAVG